jgi:tRNA pseudouridine38-40 synthase
MNRVRFEVAYDGSDYKGWQKQAGGEKSVQETIETVLSRLFDEPIKTVGSGRTDAGAHALRQNLHFDTSKNPADYNLIDACNKMLPETIWLRKAWQAPEEFHALHSTTKKTYTYRVLNRPQKGPFSHKRALWVAKPLDFGYLAETTSHLVGTQDFASFQSAGTPVPSTVRTIFSAEWRRKGHWLDFRVTSDGFLKQMVRNIVGTLLELHKQKAPPEHILKILAACDRTQAGPTISASGLYLTRVFYPDNLDIKCRRL